MRYPAKWAEQWPPDEEEDALAWWHRELNRERITPAMLMRGLAALREPENVSDFPPSCDRFIALCKTKPKSRENAAMYRDLPPALPAPTNAAVARAALAKAKAIVVKAASAEREMRAKAAAIGEDVKAAYLASDLGTMPGSWGGSWGLGLLHKFKPPQYAPNQPDLPASELGDEQAHDEPPDDLRCTTARFDGKDDGFELEQNTQSTHPETTCCERWPSCDCAAVGALVAATQPQKPTYIDQNDDKEPW